MNNRKIDHGRNGEHNLPKGFLCFPAKGWTSLAIRLVVIIAIVATISTWG